MIYQRVHSATLAIAQQHERMMEEMEKSLQVHPWICGGAHGVSEQSKEFVPSPQLQAKNRNLFIPATFD